MSEANGDTCADLAKLKLEQNGGGAGEPAASITPVNTPVTSSPGPDSIVAPSTPTNSSAPSFAETFRSFAKFGDTKSDGKHITLSQSDKWMKQAKVIDGKKITTTDTGIHFKKLKIMKAPLAEYKKFLEDLAKAKKMEVAELREKMAVCGTPGHTGVGMKTTSTVNRLTDTSKYTGTHKQRFDDSGKGKGISGRKDLPDGAGYVSGYQNKDTFGKPEEKTS